MYGSRGGRCPQKKDMEARRSAISEFWGISGEIRGYFPILSERAWKKPAAVLFLQLLDGDLLPVATERCIGA